MKNKLLDIQRTHQTQRLVGATTVPALLEQQETLGTSFAHTDAGAGIWELWAFDINWEKAGIPPICSKHHCQCPGESQWL